MDQPIKVAICVGHSRRKNGRIEGGAVSTGGMQEHEYNKEVARKLAASIARRSAGRLHVIVYDEYQGTGYDGAMHWLADQLKLEGVALAVELHFNSNDADDNPQTPDEAHGFEVLFWHNSDKSGALAQCGVNALGHAFPQSRCRGVKPIAKGERGWQFLYYTPCPAVILEPFFGSNLEEWARFSHLQAELADAYADTIFQYLFP